MKEKIGSWIESHRMLYYTCSSCNQDSMYKYDYCPHCGTRMMQISDIEELYKLISSKAAKWIDADDGWFKFSFCSHCHKRVLEKSDHCPGCGREMINAQGE